MNGLEKVFKLLRKDEKRPGSDYTATVSRVDKGVAYVQISGAEITDTPVSMSVDAKPGDVVRVRVNNGKAWLTGNDSRPPTNDSEQMEKTVKRVNAIDKRLDTLLPRNMAVKRATVYNNVVQLNTGNNHITFSLPSDFKESLGARLDASYPMTTWTGGTVTMNKDGTVIERAGYIDVTSGSAQNFRIVISVLYR